MKTQEKENKIKAPLFSFFLFLFRARGKKEIQFNSDEKNYLEKVFSNTKAIIYKINY